MNARAFIEPSIINRAADDGLDGATLRAAIEAAGFTPTTGLHTVYELARGYLGDCDSKSLRIATLFRLLRDLEPTFQQHLPDLLKDELLRLRTGTAVLPFLNQLNATSARYEIARLGEGICDDRARAFILAKEQQKLAERLAQRGYAAKAEILRKSDPTVRALKTFSDVWAYFERKGDHPASVMSIIDGDITHAEAAEMVGQLDSFPATRNAIRANTYLMFIMITKRVAPGKDKLDDYRHTIEAAYCDAFISGDDQQLVAANFIAPELAALSWTDIRP